MKTLKLFIGDKACLVMEWKNGLPAWRAAFQNSATGVGQFEAYLEGRKHSTASILVDLVEEDYRQESIPHLGLLDRKHYLAKKLVQYYRHTPFNSAVFQGKEGKNDRVLFSAMTSPNLILPWVELLAKKRIPLTGICSVALLSEKLIGSIHATHLMLLSFQEGTGLRQSFFLNGRLNFSRLTLIRPEEDPLAVLRVESARAYNYLHALNLLPETGVIPVLVLCDENDSRKLGEMIEDTPSVRHVFIDPHEAARRTGFRGGMAGSDALPIFLHLQGAANHYGNGAHRHLNDLRQLRVAAHFLSASLVAAGLILAAIDASMAIRLHRKAGILEARSDAAMLQYRKLVPPERGAESPQKMKAAVMLAQILAAAYPKPENLLSLVSRALEPFPTVRMNRISWQTSRGKSFVSNPGEVVIDIEGEIFPFDGNFRAANESVENFCSELGKTGMTVQKIKLPLNLSPGASLVGKTGREKADFAVRAFWKRVS